MPEEKSTVTIWFVGGTIKDMEQHEFIGDVRITEIGSTLQFHTGNWTFAIPTMKLVSYSVEGIAVVHAQHRVIAAESERPNDSIWPESMMPGTMVTLMTGERVTVRQSKHPVRGLASVVEEERGIIYDHSSGKYRWMNAGDWH